LEFTKSAKTESLQSVAEKVGRNTPRVTVLGIGNLLLQDEGVGVHLVQELASRKVDCANLAIIDAGTTPDFPSLLDPDIDKLIIVDAVNGGNDPGTIYRLGLDDLNLDSVAPVSLHEIGLVENLWIMSLLGKQPKSTVVIGIEPKTIDYGLDLSPQVKEKLPKILELVLKEIEDTNIAMEVDR
jgi:hydrogenase maturation protease